MSRLLIAIAVSTLLASCATPEKREEEKERRADEARAGVITRIIDLKLGPDGKLVKEGGDSKYVEGTPGQRINVLLKNEQPIYIVQPANPNLRVGDKVRIEDTPSGPRVVPR